MTKKKKEVYVITNKAHEGKTCYLSGVCSTFKKAKKVALKGWNGVMKIIRSEERHINKVGLNSAYYIMKLTNVNGTSSYFIEIKKVVVDDRI